MCDNWSLMPDRIKVALDKYKKYSMKNVGHLVKRITDVENKSMVTKRGSGRVNWEIGIDIYTLLTLCIKIDNKWELTV